MRKIAVIGVFVVVCAIYAVAIHTYRGDSGRGIESNGPTPASAASSDPPKVASLKQEADDTLRQFVSAYYSRDIELLQGIPEERRQRLGKRVSPFATATFIDDAIPPLDTKQEKMLLVRGGSVKAELSGQETGHFDDQWNGLEAEVVVRFTVSWPGERTVVQELPVTIGLVRQDDRWLVSALADNS